jgi:hypothetical protein
MILELWVPAEELKELNWHIVGLIEKWKRLNRQMDVWRCSGSSR